METKKIIIGFIFTILFLTGCSENGEFTNAQNLVPITVICVASPTTSDIDTYVTMLSGDILVTNDNNTTIKTYHNQSGLKKVCLVSGKAYLIRK